MKKERLNIKLIKPNPKNPRWIRNENFVKLVKSIINFPDMLELRPIIIDENNIVLGGNMRYKACLEAGMEEIPVIRFEGTEQQKKELVIRDNVNFGEWDYTLLTQENSTLEDWGLQLPEWMISEIDESDFLEDEDLSDEDFLKNLEIQNSDESAKNIEERNVWEGTYILLQFDLEDFEFIKKSEPLITKKTNTKNLSDAFFVLFTKK
jgi:hypothetical protein